LNGITLGQSTDTNLASIMESTNFMERFWQLVEEKANSGERSNLNVYIFTHRDGHIFIQAYNDYHMFLKLYNEKKLIIADGDLFEILKDFYKDYETKPMIEIVDRMLLDCGHWSDFWYKKIEFMKDYGHF
jgi:hypothetical protein